MIFFSFWNSLFGPRPSTFILLHVTPVRIHNFLTENLWMWLSEVRLSSALSGPPLGCPVLKKLTFENYEKMRNICWIVSWSHVFTSKSKELFVWARYSVIIWPTRIRENLHSIWSDRERCNSCLVPGYYIWGNTNLSTKIKNPS